MGFTDGRRIAGLYAAQVVRSERVTPHMVRVTFAGDDLARLPARGFDQWFRLFLPRAEGDTDFGAVPEQFGMAGYLKYLTARSGTRPPFRNYTVRAHRPELHELDVDFVAHGDRGIAGPWAQRAKAGEQVVLLDQGRGYDPLADAAQIVLAGDESALPAIAGILRDLSRNAAGVAIVEVPAAADAQPIDAPAAFEIRWLPRVDPDDPPGVLALAALRTVVPDDPARVQGYVAGEQALATGGRRHLVAMGVPKERVAFTGYWRQGRAG